MMWSGLELDREQVQALFDGADANSDGELSLPEFEVLYAQAMGRSSGAFAALGAAFKQVGSPVKAVLKRMPSLNKGSANTADLDQPESTVDSTPTSPVDVAVASSAEAAAAVRAATAAAAGTTKVVVEGGPAAPGAVAAASPRVKGGDVNPRRSSLLGRFMPAGTVDEFRQQMTKESKKKKKKSSSMDNSSSSSNSSGGSSRSSSSSSPAASPTAATTPTSKQSLSLDSDSSASPSGSPRYAKNKRTTAGPAPRRLEVTLSALEATAAAAESSEPKDTARATLLWAGVAAVASALNASPRALEAAAAAAEASGDATRAALLWAGVAAAAKRGDPNTPRPSESRRAASFRLGHTPQKSQSSSACSSACSSSASSSASSNAGSMDDSLRGSLNLDGAAVDERVASFNSAAAGATSKSRTRNPPPLPKARNGNGGSGSKNLTVNTGTSAPGVVDLAALDGAAAGDVATSSRGQQSPNLPALSPRSRSSSSSSSSVSSGGRQTSPDALPTNARQSGGKTPAKARTQTVSDLSGDEDDDDDDDEDAAAALAREREEMDEFDSEWTVVGPLTGGGGGGEAKDGKRNPGDDTLAAPVPAADALASVAAGATSALSKKEPRPRTPPPEPKALPLDWELWSATRPLDNLTLFLLHAQLTPLPPPAGKEAAAAAAVTSPRTRLLRRASSMASPSSSSTGSSKNSSGPIGPLSSADAQSDFYAVG